MVIIFGICAIVSSECSYLDYAADKLLGIAAHGAIRYMQFNEPKSSSKQDFLMKRQMPLLDILFLSNHNIHKSSYGICFWASEPFIDRCY